MCMKSRKQCYQLLAGQEPKSSAAWRIPAYPSSSPHYLDTTRKGKARSHSQDHWNAVFHSTSVLGRLFDYAQFTVMAVETQHAGTASVSAGSSVDEPAVKLDPDYNIDAVMAASGTDTDTDTPLTSPKSRDCPERRPVSKHQYLQAATDLLARCVPCLLRGRERVSPLLSLSFLTM
jgi:hypothetical protein